MKKDYFGKMCARCQCSYGEHGAGAANCPRRYLNGKKFNVWKDAGSRFVTATFKPGRWINLKKKKN